MEKKRDRQRDLEQPIKPGVYPVIDNDLARDNIENDIPDADLQDLRASTAPAHPHRPMP